MSGWTGQYHGKALWSSVGMVAKHRINRNAVPGACAEMLSKRHRRQSHRCPDGPASTMETPCGALWGIVAKHRIRSRIQAQGGARSVRRDALEIASSEPLNWRHTMQYKANIEGIQSKAIDVWMDRPVPWKSPVEHRGHGCETPDPQQDCSPRRCQKRVQRCSRNSIFGTAEYKAYKAIYKANLQGIQGKAIDVWMDRPIPWNCV